MRDDCKGGGGLGGDEGPATEYSVFRLVRGVSLVKRCRGRSKRWTSLGEVVVVKRHHGRHGKQWLPREVMVV